MELKHPIARSVYNAPFVRPAPPTSLYKSKPKPRVVEEVEKDTPPVRLINSVDDAIIFFSKKIGLEKELLLILINTRYKADSYENFKKVDKLDLMAQLTQVKSVAELSKRLGEVPPIDWTRWKYYLPE